jgi:hypothetical protein
VKGVDGDPFFAPDALRHVRVCLGPRLRAARTLEEGARAVCEVLYEGLPAPDGRNKASACALVRCFKTHALEDLEPALQRHASTLIDRGESTCAALPCLVLLASAGDEPTWCSRHTSAHHRVIPLPNQAALDRRPMIAGIFRDFNICLDDVRAHAGRVASKAPKVYDVFHVEDAGGSARVPDQDTFVRPYGIRSVVGFGGSLRHGDLFVVLCFMKAVVPIALAKRVRGVALDVTTSFFRFDDDEVFEPPA